MHHRWTIKFCSSSSKLYPLCLRFLNGDSLDTLPELKTAIAPMKFVILIEASAERNHHVGSHGVALRHRHTESFFSLVLRMPFIQRQLDADPDFVTRLAEACGEVRDSKQLACRLGLISHPRVVAALTQQISNRALARLLRPMVYRCDAESQYANMKDFASAINYRNVAVQAPRIEQPEITTEDTVPQMLQLMATRHFQELSGDGRLSVHAAEHAS